MHGCFAVFSSFGHAGKGVARKDPRGTNHRKGKNIYLDICNCGEHYGE